MQAATYTAAGLTVEILGVFLLSVEAIRLPNFRKLRDHIFKPLHHAIQSPPLKTGMVDLVELDASRRTTSRWLLSHLFAGALGIALMDLIWPRPAAILSHALVDTISWPFWLLTALVVVVVAISVAIPVSVLAIKAEPVIHIFLIAPATVLSPVSFLLMLVGEILHQLALGLSWLSVAVLDFIDSRTPDGTIGIMGFVFAFIGYAMQVKGTLAQ